MSVAEIKVAIEKLSPEVFEELASWMEVRRHELCNSEIGSCARAGKLISVERKELARDKTERELAKIRDLRSKMTGFMTADEIDAAKRDVLDSHLGTSASP